MPTASSARLLAGVAAGGQADSFKSSDRFSLFGSSKLSNNACKPSSSHGQLSTASECAQQAGAGSLSSRTGGTSKWGQWPLSPPLSRSGHGAMAHEVAGTSTTGSFLIKAKVASTLHGGARGTSSNTAVSSSSAMGLRSSSAPRSRTSSFGAAKTLSQATSGSSTRQLLSPTKQQQGAGSTIRSGSTGRNLRVGGSLSAPASNTAGTPVLRTHNAADASSSGVAAVPGRARVMPSAAASCSPGDAWSPPSALPHSSRSSAGPGLQPAYVAGGWSHNGTRDAPPAPTHGSREGSAGIGSSSMARCSSLDAAGPIGSCKQQQKTQLEKPPLFDELVSGTPTNSSHRPRAPEAAARLTRCSSQPDSREPVGSAGSVDGLRGTAAPQPPPPGSSYLARLRLQRAATADAISRSSTSTGSGNNSRRVNSAGSAGTTCSSTSSKLQALDHLKAERARTRAATSSGPAGGGAGSTEEEQACPSNRSAAASSAPGTAGARLKQQRVDGEDMGSAVASLAALLDRLDIHKKQLGMNKEQTAPQLQQQQSYDQRCPNPEQDQHHAAVEQLSIHHYTQQQQQVQQRDGQQAPSAQQLTQQENDSGSVCNPCGEHIHCDVLDRADCGPGERLEFPMLHPAQPSAAPSAQTGSYLDVIRCSRATSKPQAQQRQAAEQTPPPQQQQTTKQEQQQQEPPSRRLPQQPPQQLQRPQLYQPRLYQQQQQHQPPPQQQVYQPPPVYQQQQCQHGTSSLHAGVGLGSSGRGVYCPSSMVSPPVPLATYRPPGAKSSECSSEGSHMYRLHYAPPQPSTSSIQDTCCSDDGSGSSAAVQRRPAALVTPVVLVTPHGDSSQQQASPAPQDLLSPSTVADDTYCQYRSSASRQQQAGQQVGMCKDLQHKQQLVLLSPEGLALDGSSDGMLQHPGFLIGTQPMSEHSGDMEPGWSSGAHGARVCADMAGSDAISAAAADAAARRAFLAGSAASSSAGSDDQGSTAAAAAANICNTHIVGDRSSVVQQVGSCRSLKPHPNAETPLAGVALYASSSAAAAGAGQLVGSGNSSRPSEQCAQFAGQVLTAPASNAGDTSDSDTDVSEMSSSLDSASSSNGSVVVTVEVHPLPSSLRSAALEARADAASILHQKGSSVAQHVVYSVEDADDSCHSRSNRTDLAPGTPVVSPRAAVSALPIKAYARSLSRTAASMPRGCCGIKNVGNTCYQNSCVQLLSCVPELVGALLGPQALQLFRAAAAAAADAANNRSGRGIQQALRAAAAAAHAGIDWLPNAAVGPALQDLLCEMWGFQQQQELQQPGSQYSQQQQQLVQQRHQLQRVTDNMDALRCAMAEVDPRWDDGEQWDCQEALCCLLQIVHNESNRVRGKPQYRELKLQGCEVQQAAEAAAYAKSWEDSVVLDIFSWQLQSTMTCRSCGKRSHAFDSSQELLVAIPAGSDNITLQECLARTIFSPEKMHGEEGYKCDKCKAVREATKQLQLFTYPQVLVLGLKRFETRGGSKGGNKVAETYISRKVSTRVRVDARDVLDLSAFCNPAGLQAAAAAGKPPPKYELIAVADHSGFINGGHYTARGRCVIDGSWADFNDSLVAACEPPSGSSSEAYMMLYRLIGYSSG